MLRNTTEYIERERRRKKQWKLDNPEKVKASAHKYYLSIRDKHARWAKAYYKEHREEMLSYSRAWAKSNRLRKKLSEANTCYPGVLTLEVLQRVYEDNIIKFGTLTCYLCKTSIPFGDDVLEHKLTASRGGTNEYSNLGIAHTLCNNKKRQKTEEEYREVLNG